MSIERIHRHTETAEVPVSHNAFQARLAEYAFKIEHPGVTVGRNEIMMDWVREHAADWRTVIEAHEGESVSPDDEAALEKFYKEMLAKHSESGSTMH